MEKKKVTKSDLRRKITELESQLAHVYFFADVGLDKAGQKHFMASGIVMTLTGLGGREIIPPVCIKDGLSQETIDAIRADLRRSYDLSIIHVPREV